MKHIAKTIGLLALGVLGLASCQDDFDGPGLQTPVAKLTPTMTLTEFKTAYWQDDNAYVVPVGEMTDADGNSQHVIISGRVISSDASGNIYKNLVIQEEGGETALAMSINANSLYNQYRIGQEIVIDATGMYVGKYRGLMQLCFPNETDQGTLEGGFMPLEVFEAHAELNGLPQPSKIDTLVITHDDYASASPAVLRKYQSQLVRFNGVHFKEGGEKAFTDGSKITSNRTLVFANGDTINVRTSGYSNFWAQTLPEGDGDVVGILSYFNSGNTADPWQLLIRSTRDLLNFGGSDTPGQGDRENPFTVDQVIEIESNGESGSGWVTGYIVGAVLPGTGTITSNDDIEWTADVSMPNTLVIAPAPDIKEAVSCLVVELPQGSALRQYGNLLDNPGNYKKQIWLKGTFAKVLGTWGITGNTGSASEFAIDGVDVPGGDQPGGDDPVNPPSGDPVSGEVVFGDCGLSGNPTTFTSGNFEFTCDKAAGATAPAYHANTKAIRLYNGNTITIKTIDGAPIDRMVFTLSSDAKFRYTKFEPSTGALAEQKAGDTSMSWTGNANTVTFTVAQGNAQFGTENTEKGQIRITKVVFGNGSGDTPDNPDNPDNHDNPDNPDNPTGAGTESNPYDVAGAIAQNNSGATAWVKGYIVGWADGSLSATKFDAAAGTAGNIVIADAADVKDASKCIVVALPKGTVRTAVNLMDNPENLGKPITLQGKLDSYLGGHGLTGTSAYKF